MTGDGRLQLEDMHIELPDVNIGALELSDLKLDFTRKDGDSVWRGQGELCLAIGICVDAAPGALTPPGGVVIRNGELDMAFMNVGFTPGIALYPNVFLDRVGAGTGIEPDQAARPRRRDGDRDLQDRTGAS